MNIPVDSITPSVSTVSSLDDRRRIKTLEAQNAELEGRLAAALRTVQPTMDIDRAGCRHYGGTIVDDDTPRIVCKECGLKLDPYDVLRRLAHEETRFCFSLNSLREEQRTLRDEIDRLKAQRSTIQRQIRRGKDAPPAGLAARLRAAEIGELGIRRRGKTHEWIVSAKRAEAGALYRSTDRKPDVTHHGPLEDALEAVLVALGAAPAAAVDSDGKAGA